MALTREVYEALENIVGSENITEEPATLDSYAYQWMAELVTDVTGGSKFFDRPEAVLMPGSTEDVQAIIKACNRNKIKVSLSSVRAGVHGLHRRPRGRSCMDLRRMDQILK